MNSGAITLPIGTRVRKSPFFNATREAGCTCYTIYNHTYMPVYYEDPVADYWHLVNDVTLWDVACQRQVEITGPDAFALVSRLTPRNLANFKVGQAKYAPMVDGNGGMLNDPILLRLEQQKFWFSLADYDILLWAKGVAIDSGLDVDIREPDVSPLQVQGPNAVEVIADLFGGWVRELKYYWFKEGELDGIPYLLSRTGWSNEKGFEVFLQDSRYGHQLWDRIMEAGARYGIQPGAPSQIKRMEAGLLSYWNDMDIHTNPFEVGLGNFIDTDQDVDFVGKSALQDILKKGISQRLMGAVVDGDPILVNEECWPVRCGEQVIGKVTSAVYSPLLDQNLVYVMLPIGHAKPDAIIDIVMPCGDIRSATITQLPFTSNRAR